ncbi:4017_t:CDS:2, partial [Racocetra fulgida]
NYDPKKFDEGFLPKKLKKKKKVPPPPPPIINIPGFVRISGARHNMVVYFEELRRDNSRRKRQGSLIVHGEKYIKDLIAKGHHIKSIGITAPEDIKSVDEISGSSGEVFKNIDQFPADRYYVTSVEWTRKILGGEARVNNREIWAELPTPNISFPQNISKLLVLDHVIDAVNVGMLIRAANALQIYNEKPSSRIALVLGSKMHGVTYRDAGQDIIRVSIPMINNVNSLNVAMAGNILMHEINRLMNTNKKCIENKT